MPMGPIEIISIPAKLWGVQRHLRQAGMRRVGLRKVELFDGVC